MILEQGELPYADRPFSIVPSIMAPYCREHSAIAIRAIIKSEMAISSLRHTRLLAGLTQQQAATRLGVSQSYYSQMETGARRMPPGLALPAVKKLRMSPVSL